MAPSTEVQLIAAHEVLSAMPQIDLAKALVKAQATALEYERKLEDSAEETAALHRTIRAAQVVLETVVQVVGRHDLLTQCECVRAELVRLRNEKTTY